VSILVFDLHRSEQVTQMSRIAVSFRIPPPGNLVGQISRTSPPPVILREEDLTRSLLQRPSAKHVGASIHPAMFS
jgi:hypothetical protein